MGLSVIYVPGESPLAFVLNKLPGVSHETFPLCLGKSHQNKGPPPHKGYLTPTSPCYHLKRACMQQPALIALA